MPLSQSTIAPVALSIQSSSSSMLKKMGTNEPHVDEHHMDNYLGRRTVF